MAAQGETVKTLPGSVMRVEEKGWGRSDTGPSTFVVSYLNSHARVPPVASVPLVCLGITGPTEAQFCYCPSQELTDTLVHRGRDSPSIPPLSHLPQLSQTLVTQGHGSLQWFFVSQPPLVYLLSASLEKANDNLLILNKQFIRTGGAPRSQTPSHGLAIILTHCP